MYWVYRNAVFDQLLTSKNGPPNEKSIKKMDKKFLKFLKNFIFLSKFMIFL
jgi:hypothetical protein